MRRAAESFSEPSRLLRYRAGREGRLEGPGRVPRPLGASGLGGASRRAHVYRDLPGRPLRSVSGSLVYSVPTPTCSGLSPSPYVALSPLVARSPRPPPDRPPNNVHSTLALAWWAATEMRSRRARPPSSPAGRGCGIPEGARAASTPSYALQTQRVLKLGYSGSLEAARRRPSWHWCRCRRLGGGGGTRRSRRSVVGRAARAWYDNERNAISIHNPKAGNEGTVYGGPSARSDWEKSPTAKYFPASSGR